MNKEKKMYHPLDDKHFNATSEIELIRASFTNIDTQGFDPNYFEKIKYKFTVYENPKNDFEIVFFRDEVSLDYLTPRMYVIRFTTINYPEKGQALDLEDDVTTLDVFERVPKYNSLNLCYEYETLQDNVWEDSTGYLPQELTDFFQDMLKDKAFCEAFIKQIS